MYGLNFALMHFGTDIERMESSVRMTDTGVDAMESITLFFRDGRMAVLTHDIYSRSDRKGIFYGEKGYIVVENINNPRSIAVYDAKTVGNGLSPGGGITDVWNIFYLIWMERCFR